MSFKVGRGNQAMVLSLDSDRDRTVVRPHDFGQYLCFFDFRHQAFAYEKVVYSPADVSRAGVRKVTPPGVVAVAFGREMAEGIDESRLDDVIDTFTFFVGEAVLAAICFR